jgi:hypothetical protein
MKGNTKKRGSAWGGAKAAAPGLCALALVFGLALAGCDNGSGPGGGGWTAEYAVGDTGPGGGKIFYVSEAGFTMTDNNQVCHYLEAAPADIGGDRKWASSGHTSTNILGTGTAIGTGRKNTALILATDADAPAAKACKDLDDGGKTDWFLPSKDELNRLYENKASVGGFYDGFMYWSSSQNNGGTAWGHYFSSNNLGGYRKDNNSMVRAVRAF